MNVANYYAVVKKYSVMLELQRMKKPELARAIKSGLVELEETARQIGVPSSSLRNWLKRNQFPQNVLPSLAKLAGLPTDITQLAQEYEFQFTRPKRGHTSEMEVKAEDQLGLVGIFRRFELQARSFEKMQRKFGSEVREFFSAMRAGDVFFYVSLDLEPLEWEQAGWMLVGDLVREAVERGAFFIYCLPNEKTRNWAKKLGIRSIQSDWETEWSRFRENIEKGLTDELRSRVTQCLHKIECDPNCFMVPDHKYTLFICKNPLGTDPKSFVLLPTDTANPAHLPLHSRFTATLAKYLLERVRNDRVLLPAIRDAIIQ